MVIIAVELHINFVYSWTMSRLVPSPLPEKNCVKIFKRSRIRELSQSLLSKKRIPVASLNLKSQLRQSNCYLQVHWFRVEYYGGIRVW